MRGVRGEEGVGSRSAHLGEKLLEEIGEGEQPQRVARRSRVENYAVELLLAESLIPWLRRDKIGDWAQGQRQGQRQG